MGRRDIVYKTDARNLEELKASNIYDYLMNGYTGKGKCIAVLDDSGLPNPFQAVEMPYKHHANGEYNHKSSVCSFVREILPDVRIVALNKFGYFKECIEWLENHKDEVDVINCSFTSPRNSDIELYKRLAALNIPITGSSGNNGSVWKDGVSYPANQKGIIAVGSILKSNDKIAKYSNGGENLDGVAYSMMYILNSKKQYFPFDGTSCSAPFVACMLIIMSIVRDELGLPKLTGELAEIILRKIAKDLGEYGFDFLTGYGLLRLPRFAEVAFRNGDYGSAYFDERVWLK